MWENHLLRDERLTREFFPTQSREERKKSQRILLADLGRQDRSRRLFSLRFLADFVSLH